MTVDSIWYILGKKLSGEASPEELEALEQMLRQHPNLHYPIQNITDLWRLKKPIDQTEVLAALQKHLLRLGETEDPIPLTAEDACPGYTGSFVIKKSRYFMRVAAFSTLALLLSYAVYYWGRAKTAEREGVAVQESYTVEKKEITTRPGAHTKIILPDGSTVLLNAGSKLTYNNNFDAAVREVALSGEAYFDVKKDVRRPFIIHAQTMNIRVLGTAFNVKSYPGDKSSETSLIRGSIEVTMNDRPDEKIILRPSEKLVVMNDREMKKDAGKINAGIPSSITISKINYAPADSAVIETSWIDNRLIFRNKIFTELAVELERKYGLPFRFEDENAKQLMFDVNFKNETIHQVLQALQLANPFNYSIEKEAIIITK
ncbi:FecR family protein [Agriterribacter sp.]|uniref:FecR family protein n=1 Tax=Agriterribacter sp. TaxID=2821509 RepID=UPI002B5D343C|nr:FecR family protein [Agriterribacter sp.]HTN08562.1 FecR family protein [Agriterribacter sp.]